MHNRIGWMRRRWREEGLQALSSLKDGIGHGMRASERSWGEVAPCVPGDAEAETIMYAK